MGKEEGPGQALSHKKIQRYVIKSVRLSSRELTAKQKITITRRVGYSRVISNGNFEFPAFWFSEL